MRRRHQFCPISIMIGERNAYKSSLFNVNICLLWRLYPNCLILCRCSISRQSWNQYQFPHSIKCWTQKDNYILTQIKTLKTTISITELLRLCTSANKCFCIVQMRFRILNYCFIYGLLAKWNIFYYYQRPILYHFGLSHSYYVWRYGSSVRMTTYIHET